jgi:hypothetical protein
MTPLYLEVPTTHHTRPSLINFTRVTVHYVLQHKYHAIILVRLHEYWTCIGLVLGLCLYMCNLDHSINPAHSNILDLYWAMYWVYAYIYVTWTIQSIQELHFAHSNNSYGLHILIISSAPNLLSSPTGSPL